MLAGSEAPPPEQIQLKENMTFNPSQISWSSLLAGYLRQCAYRGIDRANAFLKSPLLFQNLHN
jgi:hypothetical protein